jgi:hypothetical protein
MSSDRKPQLPVDVRPATQDDIPTILGFVGRFRSFEHAHKGGLVRLAYR